MADKIKFFKTEKKKGWRFRSLGQSFNKKTTRQVN